MTSFVASGLNRAPGSRKGFGRAVALLLMLLAVLALPAAAMAQQPEPAAQGPGGEASLVLPDLGTVDVGGEEASPQPRHHGVAAGAACVT